MLLDELKARFGSGLLTAERALDMDTISVSPDGAHAIFRALRDEPEFVFNFLTDLTAVDWLDRKPRFDVIYHLYSFTFGCRLRVKVAADGDKPSVSSVTDLWKAADWLERECYDMFGIDFRGHPDLRRILMYDSFVGHPLRKDYPATKRQPIVDETNPVIRPLRSSR